MVQSAWVLLSLWSRLQIIVLIRSFTHFVRYSLHLITPIDISTCQVFRPNLNKVLDEISVMTKVLIQNTSSSCQSSNVHATAVCFRITNWIWIQSDAQRNIVIHLNCNVNHFVWISSKAIIHMIILPVCFQSGNIARSNYIKTKIYT